MLADAPPPRGPQAASPDPGVLRLPETLDVVDAPDLARRLRERRGADLVLDAGAVRRIGASCAQLLLAAARAWRVDRRALALVGLSPEAGAHLALLGLDPAMLTADAPDRNDAP